MKLLSIIILVSCMVLGVNDAKESKEDFTVESTELTPKEQAFSNSRHTPTVVGIDKGIWLEAWFRNRTMHVFVSVSKIYQID